MAAVPLRRPCVSGAELAGFVVVAGMMKSSPARFAAYANCP
jgi:hypothetical protein